MWRVKLRLALSMGYAMDAHRRLSPGSLPLFRPARLRGLAGVAFLPIEQNLGRRPCSC